MSSSFPQSKFPANNTCYAKLLAQSTSKSLLKQFLTPQVWEELKDVESASGCVLGDIIASGADNPGSHVGIYAADKDAYTAFRPLIDPIIKAYHRLPADQPVKQPQLNFGRSVTLENIDPKGEYVLSTRCRVARSFDSKPLNSKMSKQDYIDLNTIVKRVCESFEGDLKGTFHQLEGMDKDLKKELIEAHYLFADEDSCLKSANAQNFWPTGRAIFLNDAKKFIIWCNEEDHLRIISMQKGGDLGEVISRLKEALGKISQELSFAHSDEYGFLTFCPTNLGTTIRCSVHIKLPHLSKNRELFQKLAADNNIQIRGIHGENTKEVSDVSDLSNKYRLGYSEEQVIEMMYNGVAAMIAEEKKLAQN